MSFIGWRKKNRKEKSFRLAKKKFERKVSQNVYYFEKLPHSNVKHVTYSNMFKHDNFPRERLRNKREIN